MFLFAKAMPHSLCDTGAHPQVDDMRPTARFPVVFQPMDSGFNSHVRDDNRRDVPFVQVLVESALTGVLRNKCLYSL